MAEKNIIFNFRLLWNLNPRTGEHLLFKEKRFPDFPKIDDSVYIALWLDFDKKIVSFSDEQICIVIVLLR